MSLPPSPVMRPPKGRCTFDSLGFQKNVLQPTHTLGHAMKSARNEESMISGNGGRIIIIAQFFEEVHYFNAPKYRLA